MIGVSFLMGSMGPEILVELGRDAPVVDDLCGKEYDDLYPPDSTSGDW